MDKLWRLMTAVFMLAVSNGLFLVGWILSGGRFNNVPSALIAWAVMILVLIGITKGILVIIDYHREHKDETEE